MKNRGTQTLETDRLILRRLELKDSQDLYEMVVDKDVIEALKKHMELQNRVKERLGILT